MLLQDAWLAAHSYQWLDKKVHDTDTTQNLCADKTKHGHIGAKRPMAPYIGIKTAFPGCLYFVNCIEKSDTQSRLQYIKQHRN